MEEIRVCWWNKRQMFRNIHSVPDPSPVSPNWLKSVRRIPQRLAPSFHKTDLSVYQDLFSKAMRRSHIAGLVSDYSFCESSNLRSSIKDSTSVIRSDSFVSEQICRDVLT